MDTKQEASYQKRFSGDDSHAFWYRVNEVEQEPGVLYQYGCYAQRLESAFIAAKAFIDSHVADPDITGEMAANYEAYQRMLRLLPEQ